MIKIMLNGKFAAEKEYVLDVVFRQFLGVEYCAAFENGRQDYEIVLENDNRIKIYDGFLLHCDEATGYLSEKHIPQKVLFGHNQFLPENDIPIIYGSGDLRISDDQIVCGIDIFASAFFMLTRWEEYANRSRDRYGRFPASASLAHKMGFLHRPVVNEYVEMLWRMMVRLGAKQQRKERKFELLLTHDVDTPLKYGTLASGVREIGSDFIKSLDPLSGFEKISNKFLVHARLKKDPFNTFDYLMDFSDSASVKSHFFFMGTGTAKYDTPYQCSGRFLRSLIYRIKDRGHRIGFHPSYNAHIDSIQFAKEKLEVEGMVGGDVTTGRQHYLRFEAPTTWQVWDDNNMEWDSSLSYADKEGFRCGTCYEYSVFNFLTRKKLTLKEKPLIVMDGSFLTYQPDVTPSEMGERMKALMGTCRKYNGAFVLVWHNSSFNTQDWRPYMSVYEDVVRGNARTNL